MDVRTSRRLALQLPCAATVVTLGALLSAVDHWLCACQLLVAFGQRRCPGNGVCWNALASSCEKGMAWEASLQLGAVSVEALSTF